MANKLIKIISYNSTGFASDRQCFIRDLINDNDPDLIFVQETWLLNSNMDKLNGVHTDYLSAGVSSMPDNELLIGRPHGGLAIFWKKNLVDAIRFVTIPGTTRACACIVKIGTEELLCVNLYLPNDNYSKSAVEHSFMETLDIVEMFIESCQIRNVILAGDMNCDFTRKNAHDVYLKNVALRNDLICCCDMNVTIKEYTYHDPCNMCFTCIDHFIVSSGLRDNVTCINSFDYAVNPSKHLPVALYLNVPVHYSKLAPSAQAQTNAHGTVSWHRVNDVHKQIYCQKQELYLKSLTVPDAVPCSNVNCNDASHREEIDVWCQELVESCLNSDGHLPKVRNRKVQKPYWKEEVKPFKDECVWWHKVWKEHGECKSGMLFEQKTAAKRQYMYAVRRYKRKEESLRRQKMTEALCEDNSRDFFREVKRMKSRHQVAPSIDGVVSADGIAQLFADKYERLYNSVPSDANMIKKIEDQIDNECEHCSEDDRVVTTHEVASAMAQLKANKSDGDVGLVSTHLLMSCQRFQEGLAQLFTAILTHGYTPRMILIATIASIPKDNRGNICDSSNYRGITLCSSISKLLELIKLKRYSHLLLTSDMQYAYKKKSSTSMCSLVVKEVANYYINRESDVYCCSVDATKAFDRIQYDRLFQILLDRKLPAIIVRSIMDLYSRQMMRTVWNNEMSETFQTTNGVRQGGVLSPVLFCVYMDCLLHRLEEEGFGCWIGNSYFGAVGYADDMILMSPTVSGLRSMLKICEEFGEQFGVQYNPKKTVCIMFSRRLGTIKPVIKLCGSEIKWVDTIHHLGNVISCNLTEAHDVKHKKGDLIQRVNSVLSTLDGSNDQILKKVFNTQCSHLYGTPAWRFRDKSVREFVTAWNRSVRRLFRLPFMTHTRYLPHMLDAPPVLDQIYSRFVNMCNAMYKSDNVRLNFLFRVCVSDNRSLIGGNLTLIANRLNINVDKVMYVGVSQLKGAYMSDVSDADVMALHFINELRCDILPGFNESEVSDMLYFICVDSL